MANFNTYQTRNLYVVKNYGSAPADPGDLNIGKMATGEIFFKYVNGDGLATRTDLIRPESIISLKKTKAAEMDLPLMKHTIAVDTNAVTLANCIGKAFNLVLTFHQVGSYDDADTITVTASVVGDATNTASAAAFHKAMAEAVVLALPDHGAYPLLKVYSNGAEVTKAIAKADSATGASTFELVEAPQKYRRGLMSNEPYPFSVAFSLRDSNVDYIIWGTDTVAASSDTISSTYAIADLEYFTLGERGDAFRGAWWPFNYEPTYLADLTKTYDVVSVEFAWQGNAENIQKSPRMIQFACETSGSGSQATSDADSIYDAIAAAMAGVASS